MTYWTCYRTQVHEITHNLKWWMVVPINWLAIVFLVCVVCPVDAFFAYRRQLKKFVEDL